MLGDIRQAKNVYIVCGYTDMRKGLNRSQPRLKVYHTSGYTDMRKGLNSLVPFVQQNFGNRSLSQQPVSVLRQTL